MNRSPVFTVHSKLSYFQTLVQHHGALAIWLMEREPCLAPGRYCQQCSARDGHDPGRPILAERGRRVRHPLYPCGKAGMKRSESRDHDTRCFVLLLNIPGARQPCDRKYGDSAVLFNWLCSFYRIACAVCPRVFIYLVVGLQFPRMMSTLRILL